MTDPLVGARYNGGEYVQAVQPIGAVIGLDVVATSQRTTGAIDEGIYLVTTGAACHFNFGDNTVTAAATDGLLMAGERVLYLPAGYIAVIKAAGSPDSIIRFTKCE